MNKELENTLTCAEMQLNQKLEKVKQREKEFDDVYKSLADFLLTISNTDD